jgi:hypothetical protein
MAKEINYADGITPILIQTLLQGNGGSSSTQTQSGGGIDPAMMAQIQQLAGGLGAGIGAPGAVTAPQIPGVSAQITPEQLAGIFQQGAQEVPTLTAAFANAAGGRSANNSGLMLALNTLNESLVREAAKLQQGQQALSTDAAYKGGSLAMQAAEINARNQQAFMNAMMTAQAERLRAMTQAATLNRAPTTTVTNTDRTGAVDPMKLVLGGMALNYADKSGAGKKLGNWWDKLWGDTNEGTSTDLTMPSQDYSMLGAALPAPQIDFMGAGIGAGTQSWDIAPITLGDYSLPTNNFPSFDLGSSPDMSYDVPSTWDFGIPDFDFGLDFNFDWGSSGEEAGNVFTNFFGDGFFADGGMPVRRNQANMGAAPVRTISGVQNRTLPAELQQLVAPINFQMPQMPQMPRMSLQQMMPAGTEPLQQPTIGTRATLSEDPQDRSSETGDNPTNQSFDPNVAAGVKNALQLAAIVSSFGGAPALAAGLGLVNPLMRAETSEDAVAAGAVAGTRFANPVMGFIAQQINRVRQERAQAEQAAQQAAALAQHQADVAAADGAAPATAPVGELPASNPQFDAGLLNDAQISGLLSDAETATNNWGRGTGRDNSGSFGGTNNSAGSGFGTSSSEARGVAKDGGSFARAQAQGLLQGPGTGTSDSIQMPMAHVSNGEYIMSADVVKKLGPQFFDMLQAAFHDGGKPN